MADTRELQQVLSHIALKLNGILDLETLLQQATQSASVLVGSECAVILLPNDAGKVLQLRAYYSQTFPDRKPPMILFDIDGTIAGEVMQSGEVFSSDTTFELAPHYPVKSLIFAPMNSRQQIVGVLGVYNLQHQMVAAENRFYLLKQLAAHAAVAIENAWIYAESQARSFELALIVDAAEAVNSTLSLPRVLSLIGKSMLKALNSNYCEIMTRDYEMGQLITRSLQRSVTWEQGQMVAAPRLLDKLDRGGALWINKQKMLPEEQLLLDAEVDDALFVPIDDTGILCLSFVGDKPAHLSEASFIPSIEVKARELQSRWQSQEHNRALHTARQILRNTEAAGCSWWLRTPDGLQLALEESSFVWGNTMPTRFLEMYPALDQALKHLASHSYCADSSTLPPDMYQLFDELHVNVLMVVPFVIQEGDTGLMLIGDTNRRYDFDSREINLAHAMVLQAANAIKNAQLFEDLQNSLEVLRRTQAKLVQTARLSAIGELAAAVAHQINNPLTTILGDTELLLGDMLPTDPKLESLQAVHRAGQRAHEVVRRLLSMSRQKSSVEVPQLMNINATIHNTLTLVEGTLYRGRIRLEINLDANLPDAYGLSGQLEDVWLNLVLNARDAVREVKKPVIEITSCYNAESDMVEVSVGDNGVGLAGVDINALFDAFYTTKPIGEGTGLGLYICANVVERCGGKITTGVSQYEGALFTVSLPCA